MKYKDIGFGNHFYMTGFQILCRTLFYCRQLPALSPSLPDVLNFYYCILEPIVATKYRVGNERDIEPLIELLFLWMDKNT